MTDEDRAQYRRFLKILAGVAAAAIGGVAAIVASEKVKSEKKADHA